MHKILAVASPASSTNNLEVNPIEPWVLISGFTFDIVPIFVRQSYIGFNGK
jgi:hypothetical protein